MKYSNCINFTDHCHTHNIIIAVPGYSTYSMMDRYTLYTYLFLLYYDMQVGIVRTVCSIYSTHSPHTIILNVSIKYYCIMICKSELYCRYSTHHFHTERITKYAGWNCTVYILRIIVIQSKLLKYYCIMICRLELYCRYSTDHFCTKRITKILL